MFLFDLDGTLVTTGGAGMKALDQTFDELYGLKYVVSEINPSGKTDPAIFREIMKRFLDRDPNNSEMARIADTYLGYLAEYCAEPNSVKTFPGVEQFLELLLTRSDIVFGLGTGNLEEGARTKLEPTGLNRFFSFGGFGSDAEDRAEMLRVGHRRGCKKAGHDVDPQHVYVIGDTELDVQAARKAGFKVIAVATGARTTAELAKSNPDFLIKDMTEAPPLISKIIYE
jgi:phosphoglycolate phosphatase